MIYKSHISLITAWKPRLTHTIDIMAGEKDTDTAKDDVIITTGMFDENLFYNYVNNKAQNTFSLSCNEMFA